jgi:hypothetical protein
LTRELQQILKRINVRNKNIEHKYARTALVLTLNDHAMRIRQAIGEVRDVYDMVIQVYLHGKNEIMQPQMLSPIRLMQILKMSQVNFPRDLEIPVVLSEAYAYVLFDIVSVDVALVEHNLVYTVQVPLVMLSVFDVFRIIPFPIQATGTDSRFILIEPEKEFILVDSTKGIYSKVERKDIELCKKLNIKTLICKQSFPLFSHHTTTDCEALLLQPIREIPSSCKQRSLDLKETLWIPLRDNVWIYVAPVPEHLTVLCVGQQPTDVEIAGSGVFTFLSTCTGYGNTVIIRSVTIHTVNATGKTIMPPLNSPHDCCEMTVDTLVLGDLQTETPIKSIPTHDEDLHLAKHKVETVSNYVDKQEWKAKHLTGNHMSLLSIFGTMIFVVVFTVLCCCCCFCRCCRNCWVRFRRWYYDDNKCKTIIFRPKIVNSVCTSSADRHRRGVTFSLLTGDPDGQDSEGEATEFTPMYTNFGPSRPSSKASAVGKR